MGRIVGDCRSNLGLSICLTIFFLIGMGINFCGDLIFTEISEMNDRNNPLHSEAMQMHKESRRKIFDECSKEAWIIDQLSIFLTRQECSKQEALSFLFSLVRGLAGDICCAGVYWGSAMTRYALLSFIHEPWNYQSKIVGFDTFQGIRGFEPSKDNDRETAKDSSFNADFDIVNNLLSILDDDRPINHLSRIRLVEGDVRQTFQQYSQENSGGIRLLHISLVVYEPSQYVLEASWDRVVSGGVIVVNGLYGELGGSAEAFFQFVKDKNLELKTIPFYPLFKYAIKR